LTRIPTALSANTYTPTGASSAETVLFVTSSQDLRQPPNDNTLSVYAADSSGNWTEQPNSPYSTLVNPTAVLAVNTSPLGQPMAGAIFVYVGNTPPFGGDVSAFELCSQVIPPQCQQADVDNHLLFSVGQPSSVGEYPIAMLVDPTNTFLYIACNGSNQVYGFSMGTASGKLTALTPAYQPTGTQPVALAMHGGINTTSEFLYSSNNFSSTITGWPVVATTGSLGNQITVEFSPGSPYGMAGK
jgi:6-phosphogluconolactonase (cycloisomerase 2 family)